ncbi:acyltransferase [Sphingomonas sp. JC676]|uniref:acyltransferase family protein n=1 Tax=Sphingomonas sp. JC676 TaxID=2768065 RepID=UPI0016586078|nr:acyltransferase [Sphingomonas sp. JC676]MBC9032767.1 acyltransferase [Sphingomonas sp. JC676]
MAPPAQAEDGSGVKGELRALTSARGIAAWLVVFFHIRRSIDGLPDVAMAVFQKGYLAVDFFFLLSGFVIWLSYSERLRAGGLAEVPAFLKRRIARIWPLHLFMLGFAMLMALAMLATGRHSDAFPFAELPFHIALVQNWGLAYSLTWNDPAWSISCELAAYLLFPLLALAIDWRRVPSAAILVAICALLLLLHTVFVERGLWQLGQEISRMGLIRCVLEFACGTAICALWLRWRDHWQLPAVASAIVTLAMLVGWTTGMLAETLVVPVGFAALLLALALSAGRRGNPLETAPLHYLGEISYATYLSHYLLWYAFKLAFVSDVHAVSWPLVALYLTIVLAASVALYHLVERPTQHWINALNLRPFRPLPPAPRSPHG